MYSYNTAYNNVFVHVIIMFLLLGCGRSSEEQPRDDNRKSIKELCQTINDNPDELHYVMTPSVRALIDYGDASIDPMLELMLNEDRFTRMRAQAVLTGITKRKYGFIHGQGWTDTNGEQHWRTFWEQLGHLSYDGTHEERKNAVKLWRQWFKTFT